MKSISLEKNGKKIRILGNQATIDRATPIIDRLNLTGIESKDRLLIQNCIDDNKIGATILYDGNTVYSFNKIVDKYKKIQKDNMLLNLSGDLYKFFLNACGDIAHYDKSGYIYYYDNDFRKLENTFLKHCRCNDRFSDVKRIFKKLKIGQYYEDRERIDLNKLSKNEVKKIIEQCNWNVSITNKNVWELSISINPNSKFCFEIDTTYLKTGDIIKCLMEYCIKFDADEYIDILVKQRNSSGSPSVRTIVNNADIIYSKMQQFAMDLLYYGRLEAQNLIEKEQEDIEIER